MIQIDDNDLPITVANKLITGIKPYTPSPLAKLVAVSITGDSKAGDTTDMFDDDDLKEIAVYLLAYCKAREVRNCE